MVPVCDMLSDFGFNTFEFWLAPSLFCKKGVDSEAGSAFTQQMNSINDYSRGKGLATKMLCALSTVGEDWLTFCPNARHEWEEVLTLWDIWTTRLRGLGVVGIFPGDPGGCSRNGCTAETYIDSSLQVSEIVSRNLPGAQVELGTWGPPFFGWGLIEGPPDWKGEFLKARQHTAWRFDAARAESSMAHLLKRLPDYPSDTIIAINLGFNPDGNPGGDDEATAWAREIAKTNRIVTWDYSLSEGENAICPHYRHERLFERRGQEIRSAPYSGGLLRGSPRKGRSSSR